jgi:hypothetical protein
MVAQYKKFCAATGHAMPAAPSWGWIDTRYEDATLDVMLGTMLDAPGRVST